MSQTIVQEKLTNVFTEHKRTNNTRQAGKRWSHVGTRWRGLRQMTQLRTELHRSQKDN
jgi:hypothetical protein